MASQTESKEYTPDTQFFVVQSIKGPKTFVKVSGRKEVKRITRELRDSGQRIVMSTTSRQEAVDKVNETSSVGVIRGLQGSSM